MCIGEAPGLNEDLTGVPFCGPAGQLFDKMMKAIEIDTETDCYITNVCLCRPIAEPGSRKQNRKPLVAHRKACKPYLLHQIKEVQPQIVLLLGRSAIDGVLPSHSKGKSMANLVGKPAIAKQFPNIVFFLMYHPSYLLQNKAFPEKYQVIRRDMWTHLQAFRTLLQDIGD
jgi:DNA polymerase